MPSNILGFKDLATEERQKCGEESQKAKYKLYITFHGNKYKGEKLSLQSKRLN